MGTSLEDRVAALEGLFLELSERVATIENGKTHGSKYSHIFEKLDKAEVSQPVTIKAENPLEVSRIVACVPRFSRKSGKAFRTMSGEDCVVILRIS